MKSLALLPLAILPLFLSSQEPQDFTETQNLTETQRTEIEEQVSDFLGSFLKAHEAGDEEGIRRHYAKDKRFTWYTDGKQAYASVDEVIARLESLEGLELSTELLSKDILPLTPTLAHARTTLKSQIHRGDQLVHEFSGISTWLVERTREGHWQALKGHTSTPKE